MVTQTQRRKWQRILGFSLISLALLFTYQLASSEKDVYDPNNYRRFVQVKALDKFERTELGELGMTIEFTRSDTTWGFVDPISLDRIKEAGFDVLGEYDVELARGGHQMGLPTDFPKKDERYHNYAELIAALEKLEEEAGDILTIHEVGRTIEDRMILGIQFNASKEDREAGLSNKPGIVYMGTHHAREHLSTEVPLMFAQWLVKNREDKEVKRLLESRDVWIIPMVNPDGVEHDLVDNRYKFWRKNRRNNGDGTMGVDLNRNYGYKWGERGSSGNSRSDTFRGKMPFSEPETQAIKKFVDDRENLTILLSFHTYSELILYPWGHTYDSLEEKRDLAVFETMAKKMATWNGYKPQQGSDLYIVSGDTTDWAYGKHGIFAFTFELSPKNGFFGGGFYPGAGIIDSTFEANIKPMMYMLDLADDPYRATKVQQDSLLPNLAQPALQPSVFMNPLAGF